MQLGKGSADFSGHSGRPLSGPPAGRDVERFTALKGQPRRVASSVSVLSTESVTVLFHANMTVYPCIGAIRSIGCSDGTHGGASPRRSRALIPRTQMRAMNSISRRTVMVWAACTTALACAAPRTFQESVAPEAVALEQHRQRVLALTVMEEFGSRLRAVAWPLEVAAVGFCSDPVFASGFTFASLYSVGAADRDLAKEALALEEQVAVSDVVPGGPAAAAGMVPGDVLVSVGTTTIPEGQAGPDAARAALEAGHAGGGQYEIAVGRSGRLHVLTVEPVLACRQGTYVTNDNELNAFATGSDIVVTSGMMRFADDQELAVVVGHEIAHNLMGHLDAQRSNSLLGAFLGALADVAVSYATGYSTGGDYARAGASMGAQRFSQDFEREADYVGAYILARAGYSPENAAQFWRQMAVANPGSIGIGGTHPTTAERFVRLERTATEIAGKTARGLALAPELKDGAERLGASSEVVGVRAMVPPTSSLPDSVPIAAVKPTEPQSNPAAAAQAAAERAAAEERERERRRAEAEARVAAEAEQERLALETLEARERRRETFRRLANAGPAEASRLGDSLSTLPADEAWETFWRFHTGGLGMDFGGIMPVGPLEVSNVWTVGPSIGISYEWSVRPAVSVLASVGAGELRFDRATFEADLPSDHQGATVAAGNERARAGAAVLEARAYAGAPGGSVRVFVGAGGGLGRFDAILVPKAGEPGLLRLERLSRWGPAYRASAGTTVGSGDFRLSLQASLAGLLAEQAEGRGNPKWLGFGVGFVYR